MATRRPSAPEPRSMRYLRLTVLGLYLPLSMAPLLWLALTALKTRDASISMQVKYLPTLQEPARPGPQFRASLAGFRDLGRRHTGVSHSFHHYLGNSLIIGLLSTVAAVCLGTLCAYGFSRFRIAGAKDWLFFILSTRFLPPLAVVVPIYMMWVEFSLDNSRLGLILLYTAFNLSLAVWLMKGFIDEIPRAYEEAALVDGYSQLHAFGHIILPQAATGIAVTAVFCLIAAWNEYGFALTLNNDDAVRTVPPFFAGLQGNVAGIPWPQVAAGTIFFVAPIIVFTVLVRRHLLRGMTFGTVKQ